MIPPTDELIEKLNVEHFGEYATMRAERKAAAAALTSLQEMNRKLEDRIAAVRHVIERGYEPMPGSSPIECAHGTLLSADCVSCYDEALVNALDGRTA